MRYKTITITPPTADLSGQLVRIKIDADADIGSVSAATGYDVYFTNASGAALPFSRLEWNITGGAATGVFDVLCDIPVAGLTIRVYYGGDATTDKQNRNTTYAGYLAVYPLNAIPTTVLTDISGNGRNAPARTDGTWSQYDHATYGKLLTNSITKENITPMVSLTYSGIISVSVIGDGLSGRALLPSFFNTNAFAGRAIIQVDSKKTDLNLVASGSDDSGISLTGKAGYFGYTVPVSGTGPDCTLRVNSQKIVGTSSSSFVRYNTFCVFGGHNLCTGRLGLRDIRVRKGVITDASAAWEYANLATPSSTLSFGSEKKISRRRHNQILEAF